MQPQNNNAGGIVPGPANQYDFIMNPSSAPKKSPVPGMSKNPLIQKIILFGGGAVVLIMVLWLLGAMLSRSDPNVENAVGIVQSQQEIIRVAELGTEASNQATRNLAITTQLTFTTQQKQLLALLAKRGRDVGEEELIRKQNSETDTRFETAKQANTFDTAFTQTLENSLRAYVTELDNAYSGAQRASERELLKSHFEQVELLMKQLPSSG